MTITDFISLVIIAVIFYILSLVVSYAIYCIQEETEYRKWKKDNERY